jgi:hypothetical protein
VYARLKLCALTKEARQAFLEDRFTAGHAILLARLKPADQKRAMDPDQFAIFDHERGLLDHADDGDEDDARLKPRSVREFQAWIDKHVRFDVEKDADPMLFPETAATLEKAEEAEERVIPITHDHMLAPSTRDSKVRTYTCRSWKRADGAVVEDSWTGKKGRSKTCEHSITGIVVAGRDRGDAFKVCIARDKCAAHWPEGVKAKQARQKAEASGEKTPRAKELERQKRDHERYEAERKREEAERERFEKATPAILEAVSAWAREAEADTDSCLVAKIVTDQLTPYGPRGKKALQAFGKVHSAQDILRRAAFLHVAAQVLDSWRASRDFAKWAKGAIGLDVAAILEKVAPAPKEAPAKPKTGKRASS